MKGLKQLKCIVFVVDSSTFNKKVKDVAELLYDVIYSSRSRIPILVACNKQDIDHAKASKVKQPLYICVLHQEFISSS